MAGTVQLPDIKTCHLCKVSQPASEFNAELQNKDGLSSYCKTCRALKNREYHRSRTPGGG